MSAFEGRAAHRARRLGAKRIMVDSNAQTPEYDGIKYAALLWITADIHAKPRHIP